METKALNRRTHGKLCEINVQGVAKYSLHCIVNYRIVILVKSSPGLPAKKQTNKHTHTPKKKEKKNKPTLLFIIKRKTLDLDTVLVHLCQMLFIENYK